MENIFVLHSWNVAIVFPYSTEINISHKYCQRIYYQFVCNIVTLRLVVLVNTCFGDKFDIHVIQAV